MVKTGRCAFHGIFWSTCSNLYLYFALFLYWTQSAGANSRSWVFPLEHILEYLTTTSDGILVFTVVFVLLLVLPSSLGLFFGCPLEDDQPTGCENFLLFFRTYWMHNPFEKDQNGQFINECKLCVTWWRLQGWECGKWSGLCARCEVH